ncbi:MAG: hypothetical protein LBQ12_01625, partial [Deltaproteobacteria bacterium]|nr:hypothetical protein [Deltaproteobacteria bacterium]
SAGANYLEDQAVFTFSCRVAVIRGSESDAAAEAEAEGVPGAAAAADADDVAAKCDDPEVISYGQAMDMDYASKYDPIVARAFMIAQYPPGN